MVSPIRNILVANRGEIVLRIIRSARKMGISVTGIYSSHDKNSLWIEQCDHAWNLGNGKLSDTYLNISNIISIARQAGADAIHPGYGFMAENYKFAQACEQMDVTFIGPLSEVLKIAGDKPASRNVARSLGIPVAEVINGTTEELLAARNDIQFPVLAKAASGGGGKGIRLVRSHEELPGTLKTISGEGLNYFGDGRIYLEQYISNARHIEIQVLADRHGNSVHLYERECSIQRRHQKIIEESPSVNLPEITGTALTEAALKITRHLGYTGAGTIEFLVDRKGNYYFLEINPRIQVEHGITEMITGVDIVKEQIRIAEGHPLTLRQEDIKRSGHAIEARIYAEDPENNLLPSPGKIHYFSPPVINDVYIESGVGTGSDILPDYDPLIAKVLIHSTDRDSAVKIMQQTIEQFVITGIRHNLSVLDFILKHKDFNGNKISSTWFDEQFGNFTSLLSLHKKSDDINQLSIAAALVVLGRKSGISESPWDSGFWRNVGQIRFRIGEMISELEYSKSGNSYVFYNNSKKCEVSNIRMDESMLEFCLNGNEAKWYILPETDGLLELSDGHTGYIVKRFTLGDTDYHITDELHENTGNLILAPQPGTVMEIKVAEGQQVKRGDYLLTIESMKLENTILAMKAGFIKKINIKAGDKVKKNEPLIQLEI